MTNPCQLLDLVADEFDVKPDRTYLVDDDVMNVASNVRVELGCEVSVQYFEALPFETFWRESVSGWERTPEKQIRLRTRQGTYTETSTVENARSVLERVASYTIPKDIDSNAKCVLVRLFLSAEAHPKDLKLLDLRSLNKEGFAPGECWAGFAVYDENNVADPIKVVQYMTTGVLNGLTLNQIGASVWLSVLDFNIAIQRNALFEQTEYVDCERAKGRALGNVDACREGPFRVSLSRYGRRYKSDVVDKTSTRPATWVKAHYHQIPLRYKSGIVMRRELIGPYIHGDEANGIRPVNRVVKSWKRN
jgi:hypothetical protein